MTITSLDLDAIAESERWMPGDVKAVPRAVRAAIRAILEHNWYGEDGDYRDCCNEPGGNQRAGHVYEDMLRVDRWLSGVSDGRRVELTVWMDSDDPEHPGTVTAARRKTVGEVADELALLLGRYPAGADESDGIRVALDVDRDQPWPGGQVIAYARPGGCEGWRVEVEVADPEIRVPGSTRQAPMVAHRVLLSGKTCDHDGDAAHALARQVAWILDAG